MARSITTRQLISSIRSMIDERNEAEIDDDLDILPALNRGFDDAIDILARKYPDSLIQSRTVELSEGVDGVFELPEDAFQERLEKVEAHRNGYYYEIKRIDYRDVTPFDVPMTAASPYYYAVVGTQYRILPVPSDVEDLRIWYIPEAGPLVPEYGRIINVNRAENYVRLTDVENPDQVSSDIDSLEAYVNLIDGRTGQIKATMQIAAISNNKVTFRTTPDATRPTVQGRTVSGSLPSTLELDDYLCPVEGTCIPPMRSPLTTFLAAYGAAELKAVKLGGDAQAVSQLMAKFEEKIERTWVRREQSLRVGKASRNWSNSQAARFWARTPRT